MLAAVAAAALPASIVVWLAERAMRFHHYLWHSARNGWTAFGEPERAAYRALGYEPPRPAVEDGQLALGNGSGEDFLYMHRQMIQQLNERLASLADPGYPRIEGWPAIPAPGDADYPVPPAGDGDAELKSDEFYRERIVPLEQRYQDADFLRSVSLGELGARLEFTLHNWMHMRWAEPVAEARPDADPRNPAAIDSRWDAPSYDWLGDFYSSHVHSTFWKLHGWVDERIDDWARANVHGAIEWQGTWTGPDHAHVHPPHPHPAPPAPDEAERRDTPRGRDFGRPLLDVTVPD